MKTSILRRKLDLIWGALIDFYENKFTIELEGKEYYFKDLPNDYQLAISHYHFRYYVVNEPYGSPMTDEQKINWFKWRWYKSC